MQENRKKNSVLLPAVAILCLGILGFSLFQLVGIYLEYKSGTEEYEELRQNTRDELSEETGERQQRISFLELREQNPEVVAWIEIPDTQIDYPVMYTDNNDYYLNHTFSGEVNSAGSIFIETLNASDFLDMHTIIYGHNMKNGSMFGGLKQYRTASFLEEHPVIYLDLEDGTHIYQIFSCYETRVDSESYTIGFQPNEVYEEYLEMIKERSAYDTGVDVSVQDYIITLSTCTSDDMMRYVVHAKKIS